MITKTGDKNKEIFSNAHDRMPCSKRIIKSYVCAIKIFYERKGSKRAKQSVMIPPPIWTKHAVIHGCFPNKLHVRTANGNFGSLFYLNIEKEESAI